VYPADSVYTEFVDSVWVSISEALLLVWLYHFSCRADNFFVVFVYAILC